MFETVLEQDTAKYYLTQIQASQRVPFGVLIYGPLATGKSQLAQGFGRLLNCTGSKKDDCTCLPCKKINARTHPDVRWVEPNEQGRIVVDQIRLVNHGLEYKLNEGLRKVVLIEKAETLNQQAANALLKTLEEPRGDTTLILSSSHTDRLLDTIQSRCQRIRLNFLSDTALGLLLKRNNQVQDDVALAMLNGSFTPEVLPLELSLLKNAWINKPLEEPQQVDEGALKRELMYIGAALAQMLRTGKFQLRELEFKRVPATAVQALFGHIDRCLLFLRRGVRAYLVLNYAFNRIKEVTAT